MLKMQKLRPTKKQQATTTHHKAKRTRKIHKIKGLRKLTNNNNACFSTTPVVDSAVAIIRQKKGLSNDSANDNEQENQQQTQTEYLPDHVEKDWNDYWTDNDLFKPSLLHKDKFVMLLPPPNVTGTLHLGHALTVAIQDTITRFKRMQHESALWVPGVDHAGIATQVVVEKNLKKTEGLSRHDLGREKFLEKVWEWKEAYGDTIFKQLQQLGTSLDWSRKRFTLDEMCQNAVKNAFVQLYDKNVIYRDNRIVSWCCTLRSAISTIEIDNIEITEPTLLSIPGYGKKVEVGVIHDFKYELVKKSTLKTKQDGTIDTTVEQPIDITDNTFNPNKRYLTISTTRMETMLGDVAVAVNSTDERYQDIIQDIDQYVLKHPLIPNYYIPIICDDELVDPTFGTGCVKITPGHDPNDYACALRHNLPIDMTLLNEDGQFNHPHFNKYNGKHRYDVREAVIEELSTLGLYGGKKPNPMAISICSRSGDIIEPMVKPQWWVASSQMAHRAKKSADDGQLTFTPSHAVNDWARWLDNNQDWCISRQLWWGHRIPAYYMQFEDDATDGSQTEDTKRWIIAKTPEEAEQKAQELLKSKYPNKKLKQLKQDEDVLDTWFSSGLFPFSVMGWPDYNNNDGNNSLNNGIHVNNDNQTAITPQTNKNKDLIRFFPNTLLETGNDILFFWVARMVMLSQELTGKLPFNHIYLHSLIRDKSGRKMSKSLGNVIDPLDVINGVDLQQLHDKLLTSNLHQDEIQRAKQQQQVDFPEGIPACGSDSLRYGLLYYTRQTGDINLDIKTIISAKHFHNKIYQASRFAMINFKDNQDIFTVPLNGMPDVVKQLDIQYEHLVKEHNKRKQNNTDVDDNNNNDDIDITKLKQGTLEQQWILNRLSTTIANVNDCINNYQLGEASQHLSKFFLEDLCSAYLEISKTIVKKHNYFNGQQSVNPHYHPITANTTLNILYYCLETFYKLLHPISPYLTEQLYFTLPGHEARREKQVETLQTNIVTPITDMLTTYRNTIGKNKTLNTQDDNIALNQFIYQQIKTTFTPAQLATMQSFIDPEVFNLEMYKEQKMKNNTQFGGEGGIHDNIVQPTDQLLSGTEIITELEMLVRQYASGSISVQKYPIIPLIKQTQDELAVLRRQKENNNNNNNNGDGSDDADYQQAIAAIALNKFKNNNTITEEMSLLTDIIEKIRAVKARLQIPNHIKPRITLEYMMDEGEETFLKNNNNDNDVEQQQQQQQQQQKSDELTIISNLPLYQHIVSILGFVSTPSIKITTKQAASQQNDNKNNNDENITTTQNKTPAIKQYISEKLLVHINVDTPSSSIDNNNDITSSSGLDSIDFSPELVKSEKRLRTLLVDVETLAQSIARTKDNPKVPEKVKQKNQTEYISMKNEIVILKENIAAFSGIVKPLQYNIALQNDLNLQMEVLDRTKVKLETAIQQNIDKGKEKNNVKNLEQLAILKADIQAIIDQIKQCEDNIKQLQEQQ